jgi:hypothetical protein
MGRAGPSPKNNNNIVGFSRVFNVYGLLFFYCENTNLVLKYPIFFMKCCKYMYVYMSEKTKKMFSCVLHTANTLTCFERSFYIKKYWKFRKCVFAWIS